MWWLSALFVVGFAGVFLAAFLTYLGFVSMNMERSHRLMRWGCNLAAVSVAVWVGSATAAALLRT